MTQFSLRSNGTSWSGWQSFTLKKTLDKANHTLAMNTTDQYQEGLDRWDIRGGSTVELDIDDNRVFVGYVQRYNPSIAEGQHSIQLQAESAAIDTVQTTHMGPYFWRNVSAESIINEVLAPFDFNVDIKDSLEPIDATGFRVGVNESPFNIIRRLADRNGLLIFTDNDGNFTVSNGSSTTAEIVQLGRGDYIEISAEHDVTKNFSTIAIKTQKKSFSGTHAVEQQGNANAFNPNSDRYRPLGIVATSQSVQSTNTTTSYVQRRILGETIKAKVKVKSPYDKNGKIWEVGQHVWLYEDLVDIDQELIIHELTFGLDENKGFIAELSLKVPQSYTVDAANIRAARRSSGLFSNLLGLFT